MSKSEIKKEIKKYLIDNKFENKTDSASEWYQLKFINIRIAVALHKKEIQICCATIDKDKTIAHKWLKYSKKSIDVIKDYLNVLTKPHLF